MTLFFIKTIYKLFIWLNVLCCLVKQRLIIIMNYNECVFHEMFKLNNRMSLSAKSFFLLDQLLKLIKTFFVEMGLFLICCCWIKNWWRFHFYSWICCDQQSTSLVWIHSIYLLTSSHFIPAAQISNSNFTRGIILYDHLEFRMPKNIYHGSKLLILNKQDLRDLRSVNHWRLKGLEIHCIFGQM